MPGCAGVVGVSQGEDGVRLPGTAFSPSSLRSLRLTVTVRYCASSSMRQCVSVADATRPLYPLQHSGRLPLLAQQSWRSTQQGDLWRSSRVSSAKHSAGGSNTGSSQ